MDTQVVHGLSIPLGKLGFYLPRTFSTAVSTATDDEPEPVSIPFHHAIAAVASRILPSALKGAEGRKRGNEINSAERAEPPRPIAFRIGRTVIPDRPDDATGSVVNFNRPVSPVGSPSPPTAPPVPSRSPPLLGISLPTRNPSRDSKGNNGAEVGVNQVPDGGYGAFASGLPNLGSRKSSSDGANVESK